MTGPAHTGKTTVVSELLARTGNTVIYVDCRECATEREFFVAAFAKFGGLKNARGASYDLVDELLRGACLPLRQASLAVFTDSSCFGVGVNSTPITARRA